MDQIPFATAAIFGTQEIYEEIVVPWIEDDTGKYHGCWAVTEPEHGSDYLFTLNEEEELLAKFGRGNVVVERNGCEWIINGQKSAWVSSAPVATHCGLHAQLKNVKAFADGLFCIVPLDADSVKKGKAVDMLGMRDDPQGVFR